VRHLFWYLQNRERSFHRNFENGSGIFGIASCVKRNKRPAIDCLLISTISGMTLHPHLLEKGSVHFISFNNRNVISYRLNHSYFYLQID
jgi:hypothetical protein